jgi:hypothetical protein
MSNDSLCVLSFSIQRKSMRMRHEWTDRRDSVCVCVCVCEREGGTEKKKNVKNSCFKS